MVIQDLEAYFNNKHPKKPVIYKGRGLTLKKGKRRLSIDVRNFIQPNDLMVQRFIKPLDLGGLSNDDRAFRIQHHMCQFLTYIYDEESEGFVEFWQFPFETIALETGDCEDGAILITSCLISAGIPSWRVRVAAGLVETGDPHAPTGGHAYTCYLREMDNNWVTLDWCYHPDASVPVIHKPVISSNKKYKGVWFSFNNEYAWGNKKFEVNSLKEIAASGHSPSS